MTSFGKNPQQLGNVGGFGGTAAQKAANATRRRQRSGGGGRPYWVDTFRPNTTEALWVRPVRGQYVTPRADDDGNLYEEETPWIERVEHFLNRAKAGALCSAGALRWFKDLREACLGCDEYWAHPKDQKTISMGSKFGIGVVDYRNFHEMPSTDKKGNIRTDKNGQPFMEMEACRGQGCMGCHQSQKHEQGRAQPWFMSKTHFNQLMAYDEGIGINCGTCSAQQSITTNMWICGNPQCNDMIFDMSTTTVSKEQMDAVIKSVYTCQRCQVPAYPVEVIQCSNCTPQGGEARRASIFDCDLLVKLIPTGDGEQTTLLVQQVNGPCPVQAPYDSWLAKMPDLDKRFPITSIAEQARKWNMQAPGQPNAGQQPQQQQMGQPPAGAPQQMGQPPMGGAPMPQQAPAQQPPQQPAQQAPAPQQYATQYSGQPAPAQTAPMAQMPPQQQAPAQMPPQQPAQAPTPQQGFSPQQQQNTQGGPAPQPHGFFGNAAPQQAGQPPLQHGMPTQQQAPQQGADDGEDPDYQE